VRSVAKRLLDVANSALDRFLFSSCDPAVCSALRILVGGLLCIHAYVWLLDGPHWFSDLGILRAETSSQLLNGEFKSLLLLLPQSPEMICALLILLIVQSGLMVVGLWSRFQAACIFLLLTSFQHRNVLIVDGQDIVMRWFIFVMIFMPLDHRWSVAHMIRRTRSTATTANAWALRLLQVEMTAIYFSSAFMKVSGETWRDGTALYYVARADDVFGRFYLPDWLFETVWLVKLCTWTVLAVEVFLPFGLWIPRLRPFALGLAVGLHLAIEYSMNLFLFQWLMLAGLVAFVNMRSQPPT
jgi:Vitamin K-dependent gamma-carboxylase